MSVCKKKKKQTTDTEILNFIQQVRSKHNVKTTSKKGAIFQYIVLQTV